MRRIPDDKVAQIIEAKQLFNEFTRSDINNLLAMRSDTQLEKLQALETQNSALLNSLEADDSKEAESFRQQISQISTDITGLDRAITAANSDDAENILLKAAKQHNEMLDEQFDSRKNFLLKYMRQNFKEVKKINDIIKASNQTIPAYTTQNVDSTFALTAIDITYNKIFKTLDSDAQLKVLNTIFSEMSTLYDDFRKENPTVQDPKIFANAQLEIKKQEETVAETVTSIQTKIDAQKKLIEQYHLNKLKASIELEHKSIHNKYDQNIKNIQQLETDLRNKTSKLPRMTLDQISISDNLKKDLTVINSVTEEMKKLHAYHDTEYRKLIAKFDKPNISKKEIEQIADDINKLNEKTDLLIKKQMIIAACIQKKLEINQQISESLQLNHNISVKIERIKTAEEELKLFGTEQITASVIPDAKIIDTSFIDQEIQRLQKMTTIDEKTTLESVMHSIDSKIPNPKKAAVEQLQKVNEILNPLEKRNAEVKQQYFNAKVVEMHGVLVDALKEQVKYWSKHHRFTGVQVRYIDTEDGNKIKNIRVPQGVGEMLIMLDPEKYLPYKKVGFFRKSKTSSEPIVTEPKVSAEQAWEQLQACAEIANKRLKDKSVEKRSVKNEGVTLNLAILANLSDIAGKNMDNHDNAVMFNNSTEKFLTLMKQRIEEMKPKEKRETTRENRNT